MLLSASNYFTVVRPQNSNITHDIYQVLSALLHLLQSALLIYLQTCNQNLSTKEFGFYWAN